MIKPYPAPNSHHLLSHCVGLVEILIVSNTESQYLHFLGKSTYKWLSYSLYTNGSQPGGQGPLGALRKL